MARRPAAALLVLVAALLIAVGLPLRQVHGATRPAAFGDHAADVVREPVVRAALADAATDAIGDAVDDVRPGAGPTVRAAVAPRASRVVASAAFRRAFRGTARRGLRAVLDDDRRRVTFTVTDVADVTTEATGPLPAGLDALLRAAGPVPILSFDRSRAAAERTARADRLASLGTPLLVAAGVLLVVALAVSSARRRTARLVGVGLLGAGAFVAVAEVLARSLTLSGAAPGQDRDVAAVVWDALVGSLLAQGIVVAAAGLLVLLLAGLGGRPRPAGRPAYPLG